MYDPLRAEGIFTWDVMYGAEYALATIHPIAKSFRQEIAEATEALGEIFAKTVAVVRRVISTFLSASTQTPASGDPNEIPTTSP